MKYIIKNIFGVLLACLLFASLVPAEAAILSDSQKEMIIEKLTAGKSQSESIEYLKTVDVALDIAYKKTQKTATKEIIKELQNSIQQEILTLSSLAEGDMCDSAIQNRNTTLRTITEKIVQEGDLIVVDYIGRLDNSSLFDSSVESVSKACDTYTQGRDYAGGLQFTAGAGQMIEGFDNAVIGKKVGETFTITIPAAEAYGVRDENAVQIIPLSDLPVQDNGKEYVVDDIVYDQYGRGFPITKIEDGKATLDVNHELAGKELIFDIHIREVK